MSPLCRCPPAAARLSEGVSKGFLVVFVFSFVHVGKERCAESLKRVKSG